MANSTQLLKSLVLLLSSTTGRDKTCRLLQYGAKFIAAILRHKIASGAITKEDYDVVTGRIERLSGNMSLTRKVLRFGRPIGLTLTMIDMIKQLQAGGKSSDYKQHPLYLSAKIGSTFSLIWFFLLDHITYFARVDLMDKRPQLVNTAEFYSSFFWLLDCLFGLVSNGHEITNLYKELQMNEISLSDSKTAVAQSKQKIEATFIDLFRNILDIPVAVGFMYPKLVSPGTIGFFGLLTSYIGCYQNWK